MKFGCEKMRENTDTEKCEICSSSGMVRGRSHYECDGCGTELFPIEADSGFVPESFSYTMPTTSNRNSLGSDIEWSKDPSLDRFRRSHDRVTSAKPLFIDIVISEITRSCGKNRISAAAADLIIKVNSEISISRLRRKMHGTSGLSPSDSKSYRTKVYAAAALHIKRSDGQINTAHRVSTEWGINHFDLVGAIRMMNRVLKGIRPSGEEDPTTARIRQLNSESESIRQYLYQIFQAPEAVHISETQIRILRDSGEPFYHGDVWVNGRFTNETPDKAAFVSVVEAMAEIGHPFARVQELYSIHPVRGLQTRVSRSRGLFSGRELE